MSQAPFERAYHIQKKAREHAEKLLEDKSRELFEQNQRLEQAMVRLEQQQSQLVTQEKLAALGQLGAGLAHELNTPNAVIQSNLEALDDYTHKLITAFEQCKQLLLNYDAPGARLSQTDLHSQLQEIEQRAELSFIKNDVRTLFSESEQGSQRIASIANSLRYFANPSSTARKTFHAKACIEQAQRLALEMADTHCDIELSFGALPEMNGLPLLLSHALANILLNAMQAQPRSGKVHLDAQLEDARLHMRICDDGSGIAASELPRVMEPFYTTSNRRNGLGLTIAQNIIMEHAGHIHLASTPANGTQVTIVLPVSDQ